MAVRVGTEIGGCLELAGKAAMLVYTVPSIDWLVCWLLVIGSGVNLTQAKANELLPLRFFGECIKR